MQLHFRTARRVLDFTGGVGGIGVDAAAAGNISAFGRVDYDLNTDIKGFDCHFVEREPGQRHRGIDADRAGAT